LNTLGTGPESVYQDIGPRRSLVVGIEFPISHHFVGNGMIAGQQGQSSLAEHVATGVTGMNHQDTRPDNVSHGEGCAHPGEGVGCFGSSTDFAMGFAEHFSEIVQQMILVPDSREAIPLESVEDRGHEVTDSEPTGFAPGAVSPHSIGNHQQLSDGVTQEGCLRGDPDRIRMEPNASGDFSDKELVLIFRAN
jgi:hypothetical protein